MWNIVRRYTVRDFLSMKMEYLFMHSTYFCLLLRRIKTKTNRIFRSTAHLNERAYGQLWAKQKQTYRFVMLRNWSSNKLIKPQK